MPAPTSPKWPASSSKRSGAGARSRQRDDAGHAHRRRPATISALQGKTRDARAGNVRADAPRAARRRHRARHAVRHRRSDGPEVARRGRRCAAAVMPRSCCWNARRMRRPRIDWRKRNAIATSSCPTASTRRVVKDDSLLSVVRFSAPAPSWLIDQLARIDARRFGRSGLQAPTQTNGSRRTPTTANAAAAARCSWSRRATASAQAGRTQRLEAHAKIAADAGSAGRPADADDQQAGGEVGA